MTTYIVTARNAAGDEEMRGLAFEDLVRAREYAEDIAMSRDIAGANNTRIWLCVSSVEVQPQAVWTEHARLPSA